MMPLGSPVCLSIWKNSRNVLPLGPFGSCAGNSSPPKPAFSAARPFEKSRKPDPIGLRPLSSNPSKRRSLSAYPSPSQNSHRDRLIGTPPREAPQGPSASRTAISADRAYDQGDSLGPSNRPGGFPLEDCRSYRSIAAHRHNYNVVLGVVSSLFDAVSDAIAISSRRPITTLESPPSSDQRICRESAASSSRSLPSLSRWCASLRWTRPHWRRTATRTRRPSSAPTMSPCSRSGRSAPPSRARLSRC